MIRISPDHKLGTIPVPLPATEAPLLPRGSDRLHRGAAANPAPPGALSRFRAWLRSIRLEWRLDWLVISCDGHHLSCPCEMCGSPYWCGDCRAETAMECDCKVGQ